MRDRARRRPSVALWLVLAAGVFLRAFRLDWGLPRYAFPDGAIHFVRPAMAAATTGSFGYLQCVHPPLLLFVLTAIYWVWGALTGVSRDFVTFVLVGRGLMVACAAASIVALHALARRLVGARAAVLATAAFALAPLHVLESHRVDPDIPMLLLVIVSIHLALVGTVRRAVSPLLGGFVAAGLAGATKYNGIFAAAVPAWLVVRRDGPPAGGRWRWLLGGAVVTALAFALGSIPCLRRFDEVRRAFRLMAIFGYVVGMPGVDLASGWTQHRYVYPLVVALPYMMGWPVYLAGIAGLILLWRRDRPVAAILLVAMVPTLLFIGGGISAVPRYYLGLCPFLAVAAGAALDRLWDGPLRRHAGPLIACAVVGYTAALSASQVARLGLGPQRAVGDLVAERAATVAASEHRPLVVAYPNRFALPYDAVTSYVRASRARIVELPTAYGFPAVRGAPAPDPPPNAATVLSAVDVVILPSWIESAIVRAEEGYAKRFVRDLEAGRLGFRLAGEFRTRYWTERLYVWGDPILATHWETAIVGYKVFVRDPAAAG